MAFMPLFLLIQLAWASEPSPHGISRHQLDNWSSQFGGPLYEFSRSATKYNELQVRFQQGRDSSVELIKLDQLINEVGTELGAYFDERVGVLEKSTSYAEQRASDYFTFPPTTHPSQLNYVSAKRSRDYYEKGIDAGWPHPVHLETGEERRFGGVNTSTSTVHVPEGVAEGDPALLREVDWTSDLDTNWIANYREHPTLYWQSYCSSAGFQRQFPGSPWPSLSPDTYDCRLDPSYLKSTSSRKSLVILLDSTTPRPLSMRVLSKILQTLTENDLVAFLPFSDTLQASCFDSLVRATHQNKINILDLAMATAKSPTANYELALKKSFDLLQKNVHCNRAVMLISENPPYDYGELIKSLQTPHHPVRLFTYQIGSSAPSRSMKRMACTNGGFYVQIKNINEDHKVLKYLQVLARPLVMQGGHMPQWTGVYWKPPSKDYVITTSMPVYDVRNNSDGGRLANFLGSISIDVSAGDLKRLVNPFKLGVGGYGVLVENNGRVLIHPRWREGTPHHSSIDIMDLELPDSNESSLKEMRAELLAEEHSYRPDIKVRIPMDGFTRATTRSHRYEYTKLKQTPYSLLLVSPTNINRFIGRLDPLRVTIDDPSVDLVKMLQGPDSKYSLNPHWHYCEYLNKNIGSKEDELIHFLRRMKSTRGGWKWRNTGEGIKIRHGGAHREEEVYRCDRELVQSLLFDANVTEVFVDGRPVKYNKHESEIITMHGALLSFIMTRSGLTRWSQLTPTPASIPTSLSTDSDIYQRSVDRYFIDPNSFTYTYNAGLITATRAIFVRKSGRSAPVAVVGVQFSHAKWARRFFDIAGGCMGPGPCTGTCSSEDYDCYVLDENGYVLVSELEKETGMFFGAVNSMVMEMLVNSDVYKRMRVVDRQGSCPGEEAGPTSGGGLMRGPRQVAGWVWSRVSALFYVYFFGVEGGEAPTQPAQSTRNRTRPCSLEYDLFNYGDSYNTFNFSYHGLLTKCAFNCDGYFNVHHIHRTNLILVVTDGKCKCSSGLNSNASTVGGSVLVDGCNPEEELKQSSYYGDGCVDSNPEEKAMREECGGGSTLKGLSTLFLLTLSLALLICSGQ